MLALVAASTTVLACNSVAGLDGLSFGTGGASASGGGADVGGTSSTGDGAGGLAPVAGSSCADILDDDPFAEDGPYVIDIGSGHPPFPVSCDMSNGGWTLVARQQPGEQLPSVAATVNVAGLGDPSQTFRLGIPIITDITPDEAWLMTDDTSRIYFDHFCVVDWTHPASDDPDCWHGFLDVGLDQPTSSDPNPPSALGIGLNDMSGPSACDIRMFQDSTDANYPMDQWGMAFPCSGTGNSETVSLWFR